ncbi:hypothetical protein OPQ81_003823 [Rhizoctonia solani]|nr:hypothetical protein OPQ81_003823 [Rhizoctonia solani]
MARVLSAFFYLFEFCGLLLAEQFFPPTVVFEPLDPQSPVVSHMDTISIDLPSHNPFAESQRGGNRTGPQSGRGTRRPTRPQHNHDEESVEEDYSGRHDNAIELPTVNPLARRDTARTGQPDRQSRDRPSNRGGDRARSRFDRDEDDRGSGITVLPPVNPFASRENGNRRSRMVQPVYEPSEPEPEPEEEEEEEESDHVPPPPPSSCERGWQRTIRPNQIRPVAPPEDDRLVVSWVDEALVSPPRSPSPRHGHHHSSVTSESESYFPHQPHRPRSVSPRPGELSHSRHRDHHSHYDHTHHSHHDRHHCRQCHRLAIPAWQPPFPMPPADWSGYGGSPYSPAPPYPFARPLYANIPDLPSLLDQCRVPYPPVPVPPVAFLRDLRAQGTPGSESPLSALPASNPPDTLANPEKWKKVLELLATNQGSGVMTLLKGLEFNSTQVDRIFRRLTNVIQVRFGERQGTEIVNRVHVVPRGRLAMGIVMSESPKLDVDLVIPSDFILRRWNITASETDDLRPKTIADALELHPASINRGEVEIAKLHWVFRAIWEQLNGSADGSIFPGGREEAERYLPKDWCALYKDHIQDSNRIRIQVTPWPGARVVINIFVKVSLSLYGQDMIVGVDQSSAKSGGRYQLIKTLRAPGVSLSEPALSPTLRTAIQLLCWSQIILGVVPANSPIRSSHFHLALTALQQLDPSDKLYIGPSSSPEPFSLYGAVKAAAKIIQFLSRAYTYKPPVAGIPDGYPFPLSSCTIMDTLSIQASSNPVRLTATLLCLGATLPQFESLEKALLALSGDLVSIINHAIDEGPVAAVTGPKASEGDPQTTTGSSSGANSDAAKTSGSLVSGGDKPTASPKSPVTPVPTGSKAIEQSTSARSPRRGETQAGTSAKDTDLKKPAIVVTGATNGPEKTALFVSLVIITQGCYITFESSRFVSRPPSLKLHPIFNKTTLPCGLSW